ncbi:hypothetical protein DSL72_005448 [Monilinia vaccinii-corymbosi]|uniref:Uncharacterized protein n=1 Tax=Monilinia vaccinii-corymbosi TaxID=61207 RepID=A0A8A3PFP2_9HELO|nr:hypothetical protein DSL72_005448 [Monilinia vaccinii-corymbosi]
MSITGNLNLLINPILLSRLPSVSIGDLHTTPKSSYVVRDEPSVPLLDSFLTSSSMSYLIFRLYVLICEKSYDNPISVQLVSHLANRIHTCCDGIVLKILIDCIKELLKHVVNTKCAISSFFLVSFSRLLKIARLWVPEIWIGLGRTRKTVLETIQKRAIELDELIGKLASLQDDQGALDMNRLEGHFGKYHVLELSSLTLVSDAKTPWIIYLAHQPDERGLFWVTLIEKKYCLPEKNWSVEADPYRYFIEGPVGWEPIQFNFTNTDKDLYHDNNFSPIEWWGRFVQDFQPLPEELVEFSTKEASGKDIFADVLHGWAGDPLIDDPSV